jgi:hypothetical protein
VSYGVVHELPMLWSVCDRADREQAVAAYIDTSTGGER